MNRIGIFPGSFDPITLGHEDIIRKAARMFDQVIIGVLVNNQKTPLFSIDERVKMIREVVKDLENVEVKSFDGLLVDFVRQEQADFVIRGIRNVTDFDYEIQMSRLYQMMLPTYETVFLVTDVRYNCISSSAVRNGIYYQVDLKDFVSPPVLEVIRDKFMEKDQ